METATLSSKGQLVIPKLVRERAQLAAGSVLEVRYGDGEIHLRLIAPVKTTTVADVAGCMAKAGRPRLSEAQLDRAIRQRLKARNAP
ncbi:MAG: AbrB/MazE/SpoVT family DNA-binding domain-containing protein [Aquabacterium sp.]